MRVFVPFSVFIHPTANPCDCLQGRSKVTGFNCWDFHVKCSKRAEQYSYLSVPEKMIKHDNVCGGETIHPHLLVWHHISILKQPLLLLFFILYQLIDSLLRHICGKHYLQICLFCCKSSSCSECLTAAADTDSLYLVYCEEINVQSEEQSRSASAVMDWKSL